MNKPRRGEVMRLKRFYTKKRVEVQIVNNIDKRMLTRFLDKRSLYIPPKCKFSWIHENYVTDKHIIIRIGMKARMSLSLDEWTEFKATYMVRNYVWKSLYKLNKTFNNRWKIKYTQETEFHVRFIKNRHR